MRFTSEFEMGSGGTASLWPPGIIVLIQLRLLAVNWRKEDNQYSQVHNHQPL
jgi:hypothetical protein